MLRGIDISNYQHGFNILSPQRPNFAIMKATEGTGYVDKHCDGWVHPTHAREISAKCLSLIMARIL